MPVSEDELAARRAALEAAGGYAYPASQTPWQAIQRSNGAIRRGVRSSKARTNISVSRRQWACRATAISGAAGWPDGTTVDADGCLWVGLWDGWAVRRSSPTSALIVTVRLPAAHVTKITFGGNHLRTAYATTARTRLGPAERQAYPLAGGVFAFTVDTPGVPPCAAPDSIPCARVTPATS